MGVSAQGLARCAGPVKSPTSIGEKRPAYLHAPPRGGNKRKSPPTAIRHGRGTNSSPSAEKEPTGRENSLRQAQKLPPDAGPVLAQQKAPACDRGQLLNLLVPLDGIELSTFALRMRDSSQTYAFTNLN